MPLNGMVFLHQHSGAAISRYRGNAHSLKCYCPQETFQLEVSKILELQVSIALHIDAPFEVRVLF